MIDLRALAAETLFSPATAARRLLDLNLSRDVVLTMFALSLVAGAILGQIQRLLLLSPEENAAVGFGPLAFAFVSGGIHLAVIAATAGIGRWLDGRAGVFDLLGVLSWLTLLSVPFQAVALALMALSETLSVMANLAIFFYAFFLTLHFVNEAHGFGSLLKSFGVMAMAVCAVSVALFILTGL